MSTYRASDSASDSGEVLVQRRRLVLGAGCVLAGCADPYIVSGSGAPGYIATLEVEGRVEVLQGGRAVQGHDGMPLYRGDEVRTLGSGYAQCRFVDGDRVWLDHDTRVRVGSIFTFFGRVFASVSGIFQVDSEFVSASSEGTEYTVTIGRGQPDFRIAVRTGAVLCRPRQARWRPVRLVAGQRLTGRGPATPTADTLDAAEYETEFGWVPAARAPQPRVRPPELRFDTAPSRPPNAPGSTSPPPSTPPTAPTAPTAPPSKPGPGSSSGSGSPSKSGSPAVIFPRPRGIIQRPSPSRDDPR